MRCHQDNGGVGLSVLIAQEGICAMRRQAQVNNPRQQRGGCASEGSLREDTAPRPRSRAPRISTIASVRCFVVHDGTGPPLRHTAFLFRQRDRERVPSPDAAPTQRPASPRLSSAPVAAQAQPLPSSCRRLKRASATSAASPRPCQSRNAHALAIVAHRRSMPPKGTPARR